MLDQPALMAIALVSLTRGQMRLRRGTAPVSALWTHFAWLMRLTGLTLPTATRILEEIRVWLCPGVPEGAFGKGWPVALDVLTLHGAKHWSPPGLTPIDGLKLMDVLWAVPVPTRWPTWLLTGVPLRFGV